VRRDGVRPEGAAVFVPTPDDKRTQWRAPLWTDADGVEHGITFRFPGIVASLPAKPIRTSVIVMENRPRAMTPLMPDPYALDQAFPNYVPPGAEPAGQGAAQ
jgi:hypothetical protein